MHRQALEESTGGEHGVDERGVERRCLLPEELYHDFGAFRGTSLGLSPQHRRDGRGPRAPGIVFLVHAALTRVQYRGSTAWATRAKNNGLSRGILALSVPDGRSNLYVCGSKASPVLKARLSARHSAPRRRPCDAEGRCGRPQCASRPRSGGQSPSLALLECVSKEQADVRAEALREVVRLVKGRPRLASARTTYTTTWADYSPPFSRLGGTEAITELPDVRCCTARGPRQTRGLHRIRITAQIQTILPRAQHWSSRDSSAGLSMFVQRS